MKQLTIAIIGAGSRGLGAYAPYALKHPESAKIVAVAEPDDFRRQTAVERFNIPPENVFHDYQEFITRPRMADAVIIATQDAMHIQPAVACAKLGYNILLEKPMAVTAGDCRAICDAVKESGIIFGVGFVLRYTPYFSKLRELLREEAAGKLITFRHTENVGYWHQAHSFVRGNWRNKAESTPMILAKCSHDLDILNFMIGSKCRRLSSFGALSFFNRANQPSGASDRCMSCRFADECLYSAKTFYFKLLRSGNLGWPLDVITHDLTEEGVTAALNNGPYGRCAFACDNDVVDNQVINFEYANGVTGTMTMTAFSNKIYRESAFHCTHGEIWGDGSVIKVSRFGSGQETIYDASELGQSLAGGHGGGDGGLAGAFVRACAENDQSILGADAEEMLAGHLMGFAAEESRLDGLTKIF